MPDSPEQRPPLSQLVDRALAQDSRRFQKLLASLYDDPHSIREAFRLRAAEIGPQSAGREMESNPSGFGPLRVDVAPQTRSTIAREAGYVGGLAHLLQAQRENPANVSKILVQRFYQAGKAAYVDVALMYRKWAEAVRTEGAAAAAARLAQTPTAFGPLRPGGERYAAALSVRGLDAEHARAHAAEHERAHDQTLVLRRARLPRTVEELENRPGGRLPKPLEIKLEAFSSDFRGKLAEAYLDPQRAELAFHEIGVREGFPNLVATIRRNPEVLGPLSEDPAAAVHAFAAAKRGARAYELNAVRTPEQAADVLLRETQWSLRRQCANPVEALQLIQAAIRQHGIDAVSDEIQRDPRRFFEPLGDSTLNPSGLAAEARELGLAMRVAQEYDASARSAGPLPLRDLPLSGTAADALQAHADATLLAGRRSDLHLALNDAANALRRAESAKKWFGIRETQLRSALRKLYVDPVNAEAALLKFAEQNGSDRAAERLAKTPKEFGKVHRSQRHTAPEAAVHAQNYFKALADRDAVRFTDRNGHVHIGGANVTAASTRELGASAAELKTTEQRLASLGDVEGTRERAVHVVQGLTSDQADQLIRAIQARNPHASQPLQQVRDAAAARRAAPRAPMLPPGAHHTAIQAAQLVRSAGEGPTM